MDEQQALHKIALRSKWDLFYLAKYILGYELMEQEVHGDLCKYVESLYPSHPGDWEPPIEKVGTGLEDQYKNGAHNLLLLLPRGTFKSSVVTIGFPLQVMLHDPNARVLIDSETYSKSKAFLAEIKGHLEDNYKYREVFKYIHGVYPDATRKNTGTRWTDAAVDLACRSKKRKEPSISVSGIDRSINGMHYDWIICDDLHSERNVTNKEQIDQVIDHWKLAYSLLDPGRPMIIIGTRWDYNDLYQEILDNHRDDYNIMIRRAIKEDGSAFFPQRLPLEELEKIKKKQGTAHFSNQYLNEPISDDDATFKRSDLVRRDWDIVKDRPINWYMMVDPSFEGSYSDFVGIIIAGMDYQRDLYVRHVLRKKMTYADIINQVFDLYGRYKPRQIVMKIVGQAKSLMYELNNEQKRRGTWLPIIEVRDNKNSKEERIKSLAPFYEFGHAFHIKDCPQLDDLEYEMLHFPKAKHDDILDAYSSILEIASPPSAKGHVVTEDDDLKPRRRSAYKPRSPITGV